MPTPTVSVVLPSYNHEQFVLEALRSILAQTYQDYEILILDDASTDRSAEVISGFLQAHPDLPIRFDRHETNQGGVITLNHLLQRARGKYIALLNSDDLWAPDKLARQVQVLDSHEETAAVFTQAIIVDENKQKVSENILPAHIQNTFLQANRSRGQWLRRFFFEQNCLCHPSVLIRKSVYEQIGYLDPRFRQTPDMQLWVRFMKAFAFHMIEEPLVFLRWHKANTSVINSANSIRGINEFFYLYREFFSGIPDDVFIEGFSDLFRDPNARTPEALECEKAFLYFLPKEHLQTVYHNIGLEKLYHLLGSPATCHALAEQYHFTYNDFFALGGKNTFDGAAFAIYLQQAAALPPPPKGIKFALGELLNKYPPLYQFVRRVYRALTGKSF